MNNWEYRKLAIVEADDFCDRWDRNGLNMLFYWKSKYPKFKISLFTIPDRTSPEFLKQVKKLDWIEICVHGYNHESNFECYGWDYDKTKRLMERVINGGNYSQIFKAPGWTIFPGTNGYPADEKQAIYDNPYAVYQSLADLGFIVVDRHYNSKARVSGLKTICIDCNPDIVHFHTWDMETGDKAGRNGFRQIEEEVGVPWDNNTDFKFISEAWSKSLIKPCNG